MKLLQILFLSWLLTNPIIASSQPEFLVQFTESPTIGITPYKANEWTQVSSTLNIYKYRPVADQNQLTSLNWLKQLPTTKYVQPNRHGAFRTTPNDSLYNAQWSLTNTGQNSGTVGADIDYLKFLRNSFTDGVTANGDTIVVAVIDNGFDIEHEDLKQQFWVNRAEIPNDSIDNDSNGFIDDINGWNFDRNWGSIPKDLSNHGTPIAGIISAVSNNSIGIAGMASGSKVLPIVINASVFEDEVIAAYDYIYQLRKKYNDTNGKEGAYIVATNSSFGVDYGQPEDFPLWCEMYNLMGSVGILSVAATSNLEQNIDSIGDIPCLCSSKYLVTVTSTTRRDIKSDRAAYSVNNIDLGAPGNQIFSTRKNNRYSGLHTGTSFAAPHVAGAIAALHDIPCADFNALAMDRSMVDSIPKLIKYTLLTTVDTIESLDTFVVSKGRLNLAEAYIKLSNYEECSFLQYNTSSKADDVIRVYPNPVTTHLNVVAQKPISSLQIYNLQGVLISQKNISNQKKLTHFITESLNTGYYLVQFTFLDGSYASKFIYVD